MSRKQPDGDYEVGRGKPPKHSRFKPGQSGNPRGRPTGAVNFETALLNAVNTLVVVTENGRQRKRSKLDLAITQMVNMAAKGNPRAAEQMFKQLQRIQPLPSTATDPAIDDDTQCGTPEDEQLFAAMVSRLKGE